MSETCDEDNNTMAMREDRNGHHQGLSRHGHQPMSDTSQLASTGPAFQGDGPGQMGWNSQAPRVYDPPEKYYYQSQHQQADPTGVYNDWTFRPDPDRSGCFYAGHEMVQEESVSTDPTLALVSHQQDSSSSFDPFTSSITSEYPAQNQEFDSSTITASCGPVGSSTSYRMSDSESELSSWSVNNPSITRSGWDGSIQGQRDYSALGIPYEHDDCLDTSNAFFPESIELENAHGGSRTQRRNQMIDFSNERMKNTYGVDPSILDPRAMEDFDRFQASVDATCHGGGIEQANPTSFELSAPPTEGFAAAPTITMPRGNRFRARPTRGRPGSGPVTDSCKKCGTPFTGVNSRNTKMKHMREKHSPFHRKCQLVRIDGSPCPSIITCSSSRRRHVEDFHTSEAKLLPTKNPKRDRVPFLDDWFEKVPKSDD